MGRDDQPKERQRRQLERKIGRRPGFDRLLIVSEGSRTEPGYFREIIADHRLPSAAAIRIDAWRPRSTTACMPSSTATITEASMTLSPVPARSTAHLR